MKKKLTTAIHKFIDIEGCEMPKGLVDKLNRAELFTYRDMVIKEHLFNIYSILDSLGDKELKLTNEQAIMMNRIKKLCEEKQLGYFRFVFN